MYILELKRWYGMKKHEDAYEQLYEYLESMHEEKGYLLTFDFREKKMRQMKWVTYKGKGFQGAIKRHGQHRGPMTHGSKFHRHQGSNGACSSPSRVFKGKGMPGHMGHVKATVQNLEVVRVDAENNLLLIKGCVPGPKKSLVTIKESVKAAK